MLLRFLIFLISSHTIKTPENNLTLSNVNERNAQCVCYCDADGNCVCVCEISNVSNRIITEVNSFISENKDIAVFDTSYTLILDAELKCGFITYKITQDDVDKLSGT